MKIQHDIETGLISAELSLGELIVLREAVENYLALEGYEGMESVSAICHDFTRLTNMLTEAE